MQLLISGFRLLIGFSPLPPVALIQDSGPIARPAFIIMLCLS